MAYVDKDIFPTLLALTLGDSGGWNLFDPPTLESMYKETRAVFRDLPRSPSESAITGIPTQEVTILQGSG